MAVVVSLDPPMLLLLTLCRLRLDYMPGSSVVVPAATATSSVAFHRSLGRRGVRTIAVSEHDDPPSFRSRYCDEAVPVTDPHESLTGYKDDLLALAMRPDVDTIAPLREEDVYVLSKYRSEFAEHVATPWPSFDTLRTVHDRERLFEAAREAGVGVPETTTLDEVDDWGAELVVKSRYALLTREYLEDDGEVELVENGGEDEIVETGAAQFLEPGEGVDVGRVRSAFKHSPHVQRFVHGPEYSLGVLYDDGEPVVETQKRVLRGVKYYCGPSVYHESVDLPELEAFGRRLLTHLDWHGPADVDVIRDEETGEYLLLEVNPRFWATIQMEINAGFDFPYYFWRMARGDADYPVPRAQAGIASHFLLGEMSYLLSVLTEENPLYERPTLPTTLWEMARSLLADRRFDLLDLDDPLPFVYCLAEDLRR